MSDILLPKCKPGRRVSIPTLLAGEVALEWAAVAKWYIIYATGKAICHIRNR